MSNEMQQPLNVEQFRSVIADKVAAMGYGDVELTSDSIRFKNGKYADPEVTFTTTVGSDGRTVMRVDGKVVWTSVAGQLGNDRSVWTTFGAILDWVAGRKAQAERTAQEQEATTKCNALLQTFPLNDTEPFTWSVAEGRIHIVWDASFPPARFTDFKDLVDFLRQTAKQPESIIAEE
jgi:hypothetical protein